jgi:serine/threonine protein kinase
MSYHEAFDEDGNVITVANLHFIQGILGQGAFGTVRLARRKLTPPATPPSPCDNNTSGTPTSQKLSSSSSDEHSLPSAKSRPKRLTRPRRMMGSSEVDGDNPDNPIPHQRSPRSRFLRKSLSAPHSIFSPEDNDSSSTPSNRGSGNIYKETTRKSPSVVGHLGLFIRSKISFDADDDDEQLVAVKIFSKSILTRKRTMQRDKANGRLKVSTALEQVEREIALMKKLSHPNLVDMYEVIDSPEYDMLYMVLEYMPLGEILTYQNDGTFRRKDPRPASAVRKIEGLVDGHFDEEQAALYFVDILHGLAYLHQHHVCHRDLKPENILLDARGIAKVGDFGVSHIFEKESEIGVHRLASVEETEASDSNSAHSGSLGEGETKKKKKKDVPHPQNSTQHLTRQDTDAALAMTGMARYGLLTKTEGTWCFWSPEMCQGSQAFSGYAADIWAAGVCLYIFVTGRLPFYSENPGELFGQIREAEISYEGLGLSNSLVDLLNRTLEKDPAKRAGVGDCLRHPFLQVARAKRIRQLSAEFEISRKRKIVLNEEDIKAVRIFLFKVCLLIVVTNRLLILRILHTL